MTLLLSHLTVRNRYCVQEWERERMEIPTERIKGDDVMKKGKGQFDRQGDEVKEKQNGKNGIT